MKQLITAFLVGVVVILIAAVVRISLQSTIAKGAGIPRKRLKWIEEQNYRSSLKM